MSRDSKPIGKTDEGAKELIIELLDGEVTGGFDVDSIYHVEGRGWIVVEFLRCDTVRPFDSHPNRYWHKNKRKFLSLWELTRELDGELILINYEASREQFRVLEVEALDETGIQRDTRRKLDFEAVRDYFKELNRAARGASDDRR